MLRPLTEAETSHMTSMENLSLRALLQDAKWRGEQTPQYRRKHWTKSQRDSRAKLLRQCRKARFLAEQSDHTVSRVELTDQNVVFKF